MIRFALALACLAAPALAETGVVVDPQLSISHGTFCAKITEGSVEAPDTVAGKIDLYERVPQIRWQGQLVPAHEVMSFGIVSKVPDGTVLDNVTITLTHPPFRESGATTQAYITSLGGSGSSINAYSFDFPEEMVLGTWTFEATQGDRLLYRVAFEVVNPRQLPDMVSGCLDGNLLS